MKRECIFGPDDDVYHTFRIGTKWTFPAPPLWGLSGGELLEADIRHFGDPDGEWQEGVLMTVHRNSDVSLAVVVPRSTVKDCKVNDLMVGRFRMVQE